MSTRLMKLARPAFLFIWAALLFLIATNIQVGWLYVIIAFFLIMLVISFVYPARMARRTGVSLSLPELMERAAPAQAALGVENRGRLPAFLVTVSFKSDDFRAEPPRVTFTHIPRRGRARTGLRIVPARRGVFGVGRATVRCGAPIALYYAEREASPAGEMVVHPRLLAETEAERELQERGLGALQRDAHRFLTDPFFHQLREGTQAESAGDIHWKLTAKRDAPIIKLKERRRAGSFTILVDDVASHYGEDAGEFERVLERAVSVAKKLVDEDMPVVLRGIVAPPVVVETAGEWDEALRWSARIELSEPAETGIDTLAHDRVLSSEDTLFFNPER